MLERKLRLPAHSNTRFSKTATTPLFTLKVGMNNLPYSRFGFVASKRIDKRAVKRNQLKRLVRRIIMENMDKIQNGNDLLFILKKELALAKKESVSETVIKTLKTQGCIE